MTRCPLPVNLPNIRVIRAICGYNNPQILAVALTNPRPARLTLSNDVTRLAPKPSPLDDSPMIPRIK